MKTNLKVLMFGLLIGCSLSTNGYWGSSWVQYTKDQGRAFGTYLATKGWTKSPYIVPACAVAASGAVTGIVYLAYKKIKSKKAKATIELDIA